MFWAAGHSLASNYAGSEARVRGLSLALANCLVNRCHVSKLGSQDTNAAFTTFHGYTKIYYCNLVFRTDIIYEFNATPGIL